MTSLHSFIRATTERFRVAGILSPDVDSELLIANSLGISRGELQAMAIQDSVFEPTPVLIDQINLRAARIPLQHILGKAHFRQLELEVGKGVFIPRPETEAVVDVCLNLIRGLVSPKVLDIGTGSGAIAISIATESSAEVTAIEKSVEAASFSQKNIDKLAPKVKLLVGDFRELELGFQGFDLVVSNPPYIPLNAVPLDPEVRDHDPELALYGGEDGLDLTREIIQAAEYLLVPGGSLVLEHADGQSDSVCELLLGKWQKVKAYPDPTGRLRTVSATL